MEANPQSQAHTERKMKHTDSGKRERRRARESKRERDRQTDRKTDRQKDRQKDRQTDIQTDRGEQTNVCVLDAVLDDVTMVA
jgi:splicing factor U2AF 65 kDa subunit